MHVESATARPKLWNSLHKLWCLHVVWHVRCAANFHAQMSMTAGLLCLYGLLNLIPGVYDLVVSTVDGQDWSGNEDVYPPVVLHLAALIQVKFVVQTFQYQEHVYMIDDSNLTFRSHVSSQPVSLIACSTSMVCQLSTQLFLLCAGG